jgi:hypothetical protein
MGIITRGTVWSDGQYLTAADLNNEFNIIQDEFNGNIDNANIKAAAGIDGTKISADFGAQALVMGELGADPASTADKGKLYVKDVGGATELFYIDHAGNVVQLTSSGAVNAAGLSTLPLYIHGCNISQNAASPTSKIDISTGSVEVDTAQADNPEVIELTSAITGIDLAVQGKNGRDGATISYSYYYAYIIYNPSTQEIAGLLSTNYSTPDLSHASLSGFTKYRLIGSFYNAASGSASIRDFKQLGKGSRRYYQHLTSLGISVLSGGTATTYTQLGLGSSRSGRADKVYGIVGAIAEFQVYFSLDGTEDHMVLAGGQANVGTSWDSALMFSFPLHQLSGWFYYKKHSLGSNININILGYEESL